MTFLSTSFSSFQLFYPLSLLLILSIQFSTILSQWRRVQKPTIGYEETTTFGYEEPKTNGLTYKSEEPLTTNSPYHIPTPTIPKNLPVASPPDADDTGSLTPINPEVHTESSNASDTEAPADDEDYNPDPKLETDPPNLEGITEMNKSLLNEATTVAGDDNPDSILETHPPNLEDNTQNTKSVAVPSPSDRKGHFILQDVDYLTKDSLEPLIRSRGLEKIVNEYNEDVRKLCVFAKEARFTHMLDVYDRAKINTMVRFYVDFRQIIDI